MSTFQPSSVTENPSVLPDSEGLAYRLFRFYRARPAGVNVYMYRAGSVSASEFGRVTEDDPTTTYDANGDATSDGWSDIEIVFWGGGGPYTVTSDQATALTDAGYTVT